MMQSLLRISRIQVTGLFGLYDHDVPLNIDDRITIIHGPNGVGKTALLRLVEALVQGKYFEISRINFQSFSLHLCNGIVLGVKAQNSHDDSKQGTLNIDADDKQTGLEIYLVTPDGTEQKAPLHSERLNASRLLRQIDSEIPWVSRVGADQWVDHRTEQLFSSDEVIRNYADRLPARLRKKIFSEPEWLTEIRSQISVYLIETQRLLRIGDVSRRHWGPGSETVVSTVQNYATELQEKITEALASFGKTSQTLDQSFPQRLLSGNMQTLPSEDLKQRMGELENRRADLKRIGLLDDDVAYPFDVTTLDHADQTQKAVMTLYVDDTAHKLAVLDALAERIALLLGNINRKFRNKAVSIDKKRGLIAIDSNEKALDLDALSSGEQHELVLLYDLLFRVRPNTLVMIDEPELSLHLSWQKSFLADLMRIVTTARFDVFLATHSPFIAGDRDDLMISLTSEKAQ